MADSPLAYWRLGETSGTVAADQRGTRNGTYANSPALGQPGALFNDPARSAGFNGTSQYVQAPADAALNSPARFSVEVWARPTGGVGTYHGVVTSRVYPLGWVLYLGTDSSWEFWVNSGSGMVSIYSNPAALNTWHHLVGTYDGTTVSLYDNGVLAASAPSTGYAGQTGNQLQIAQSEAGDNLYFPGQLEEAAVYGTALSATQVQRHYSVGTTGH
jgi:hypothetical protein